MSPWAVPALYLLFGLAAIGGAYFFGRWRSEVEARDAYLNGVHELVRGAVKEAMADVTLDVEGGCKNAITELLFSGNNDDASSEPYLPTMPVEERVQRELSESSFDAIEEGLRREHNLDGAELKEAMRSVREQFEASATGEL